jgi:hypothetical protein
MQKRTEHIKLSKQGCKNSNQLTCHNSEPQQVSAPCQVVTEMNALM